MKYSKDGRLGRRVLNRLFGQKNARPDEECFEKEAFVINMMSGCGWDVRDQRDVMQFGRQFGFPFWSNDQPWNKWLLASNPDKGRWVVVEKRGSVPMWTLFEKSMQISEWALVGENSPVTKKLVPFKNGYFKTVSL